MNNICASTARALRSSAHPAARARCLRPTNPQSRSVSCLNKSRIIPSRHIRHFHASNELLQSSPKPSSTYRGPPSEEETQTDFGGLNVLGSSTGPTTGIDACHQDGFLLNSGLKIVGGSGCFLLNGDAFSWRPWDAAGRRPALLNAKGQWDVDNSVWGLLDLVWPKPGMPIPPMCSTQYCCANGFNLGR